MRIYVIAAYPAVRAGLAAVARQQTEWRVVGESSPASLAARPAVPASGSAPGAARADAPDVLLADLDGIAGNESIDAWLDVLRPRNGVLVIGSADLDARRGTASEQATRILSDAARSAEERGLAFGALRRDAMPEEIVAALSAVGSGLIALDRRLAREVFAAPERVPVTSRERPAGLVDETLTAREREVLQLMAEGLPNKLIANRLHITEHTAKFHVSAILTKLGAASRTEAVTLAAHRGLLVL
jgi:two-component system nitrate/nitrite response regulator NarL